MLSFGSEAEDDEEETNQFVQKNVGKAKSLHDVIDDPLLSKTAVAIKSLNHSSDSEEELQKAGAVIKEELEDTEVRMQRIKDKLKASKSKQKPQKTQADVVIKQEISDSDGEEDLLMTQEREKKLQSDKKK